MQPSPVPKLLQVFHENLSSSLFIIEKYLSAKLSIFRKIPFQTFAEFFSRSSLSRFPSISWSIPRLIMVKAVSGRNRVKSRGFDDGNKPRFSCTFSFHEKKEVFARCKTSSSSFHGVIPCFKREVHESDSVAPPYHSFLSNLYNPVSDGLFCVIKSVVVWWFFHQKQ